MNRNRNKEIFRKKKIESNILSIIRNRTLLTWIWLIHGEGSIFTRYFILSVVNITLSHFMGVSSIDTTDTENSNSLFRIADQTTESSIPTWVKVTVGCVATATIGYTIYTYWGCWSGGDSVPADPVIPVSSIRQVEQAPLVPVQHAPLVPVQHAPLVPVQHAPVLPVLPVLQDPVLPVSIRQGHAPIVPVSIGQGQGTIVHDSDSHIVPAVTVSEPIPAGILLEADDFIKAHPIYYKFRKEDLIRRVMNLIIRCDSRYWNSVEGKAHMSKLYPILLRECQLNNNWIEKVLCENINSSSMDKDSLLSAIEFIERNHKDRLPSIMNRARVELALEKYGVYANDQMFAKIFCQTVKESVSRNYWLEHGDLILDIVHRRVLYSGSFNFEWTFKTLISIYSETSTQLRRDEIYDHAIEIIERTLDESFNNGRWRDPRLDESIIIDNRRDR